jgi:hypothetical protein
LGLADRKRPFTLLTLTRAQAGSDRKLITVDLAVNGLGMFLRRSLC